MKKSFVAYLIGWLAGLGLFNVVTFVTPNEVDGVSKFDGLFWVAYVFITLTFIAQLVAVYLTTRADSLQKTFYNLSLLQVSVASLVVNVLAGGLCMAIVKIPSWIGIIVCCLVLAVTIWSYVKAVVAIDTVAAVDKKIKVKTMFIKLLTADAESLKATAEGDALKVLANKVYEAVRYSDPMSDEALADVENRISEAFALFADAVKGGKQDEAADGAKKLCDLISERNAKCKILK